VRSVLHTRSPPSQFLMSSDWLALRTVSFFQQRALSCGAEKTP
jgi:hypothetical protein